jgi:hypothetical protein
VTAPRVSLCALVTLSSVNAQGLLRNFAEAVHHGLRGLEHDNDVWLDTDVMLALLQWRASLDDQHWALA